MARDPRGDGARLVLTWTFGVALVCVVLTVYAVLSQLAWFQTATLVALATVAGGIVGLALRDSRDRDVSVPRSLGEGFRGLLIALWY